MKQITQNYKTGKIRVEDVDWPTARPGGVLVRTLYSAISIGTEGMKVKEGQLSYLGKARARPDQVKKVMQAVKQQGLLAAYQKVVNKLDSLTPLGYSLSGEVISVGKGAEGFHVGQHVACAGAGYANHAEVNYIPKNLVVPVPAGVSMKHAAFATTGAIALQGFRQAQMQLGEIACVVGLGLLGQLLVQILRAAGVRVIGVDLMEARCRLAEELGAHAAVTPSEETVKELVTRLTSGLGVDCVFLTAAGASNAPVELAVQIARDRARVVDIGKIRMDLPWNDYYMKELDVRFSRSYGPGRYDPSYEEGGIDYPIGYVRWTEKRNLCAFLDLIAEEKVRLDPLITEVKPFAQAEQVFEQIAHGADNVLGILFEYDSQAAVTRETRLPRNVSNSLSARPSQKVRLGVIGAGNYASSMLLPHLKKNDEVELVAVATASSLSGQNARRKFGFKYTTTDYKELLDSDEIDAVLIATRHSSHADLAAKALRAGKAAFVEKPLALNLGELEQLRLAVLESENDRLMVGFNRRFSLPVKETANRYAGMISPIIVLYRVHAGQLDVGSWYLNAAEGTRFVGEAGHFFDLISFLTQSRPVSVATHRLRPEKASADDIENMTVTVQYENGSVGNLLYLTQGGLKVPKEYLEIFGAGKTVQMDNFESLTIFDANSRKKVKYGRMEKGQEAELKAFITSVKTSAPMPISLDTLFDTTLLTLAAAQSAQTGRMIHLADFWTSV
jgi:predicted dehydrogenase/threonine dehydrogenase-like Zn-dependent dehydrogenase